MRCLHPALCFIGIWLFSCGTAAAQARLLDPAAVARQPGTVARECHEAGGTYVRDGETPAEWVASQRIRAVGCTLKAIITEAIARSRTFRQLVDDINRTDGIVYVEHGRCGHGVRACILAVMKAGASRIVRVRVAADKADWDLMGSVGHELQHAVEVLREPGITNTTAMGVYYRREGYRVGRVFETVAAVRAGDDVRNEVRSPRQDAAR